MFEFLLRISRRKCPLVELDWNDMLGFASNWTYEVRLDDTEREQNTVSLLGQERIVRFCEHEVKSQSSTINARMLMLAVTVWSNGLNEQEHWIGAYGNVVDRGKELDVERYVSPVEVKDCCELHISYGGTFAETEVNK